MSILTILMLPICCNATQDLYAQIQSTKISGKLIEPFKKFDLDVSLNQKNQSIDLLNLRIDDKPVNIRIPAKFQIPNVVLSKLKITHSSIHAPNARKQGIIGIGSAHLNIVYGYFSDKCESGEGRIYISTRMDNLKYTVNGWCNEE